MTDELHDRQLGLTTDDDRRGVVAAYCLADAAERLSAGFRQQRRGRAAAPVCALAAAVLGLFAGPAPAAPAAATGALSFSQALVARCDELAADPEDPGRQAAGVPAAALAVQPVLEACNAAVFAAPGNPRLLYQRGRALQAGGRDADAFRDFARAADLGHAPALKAVGDAWLSGRGLPNGQPPDAHQALAGYERAAATGHYPPAAAAAAQVRRALQEPAQAAPPAVQAAPDAVPRPAPLAPSASDPTAADTAPLPTAAAPPVPAAPAAADPAAAGQSMVALCDRLASDPDDPGRREAGVPDAALAVGRAIEACSAAAEAEPGTARMLYQLGRALRAGARHAEAGESFAAAADLGYPPSFKAIGDAYATGIGLPPDQTEDAGTALAWYQRSIAAGSYDAGDAAVREMQEYIRKNTFDEAAFQNGPFMGVIYTLELDRVADPLAFFNYATGLYQELDSEQVVDHAPECKPLLDKLGQILLGLGGLAAVIDRVGNWFTSSQDFGQLAGAVIGAAIAQPFNTDAGRRDAYNLVNRYGCDNAVGKRILTNLGRLPMVVNARYNGSGAPAAPAAAARGPGAAAGTERWIEAPDEVNVRSGPSADAARVGKVRRGERVVVGREANGWSHIGRGWVSSRFLSVNRPGTAAPP